MAVRPTESRLLLSGTGLTTFLIAVHATNDAFTGMLSALLPTLQARFLVSETVLALLVATLSFSSSVTQPLFGALADRLGRRITGAVGVLLSSTLLSLMGVVPSVFVLFGILLIGGLGSAAFHPAGTSIVSDASRGNRGLAVSLFSAGGTLGLAVGPVVVLYVVANFGIGFTPWLMVPGVVLGVLMYFLIPPQPRARGRDRPSLFDASLFRGPVGLLCLSGILRSISFVTFVNAVPLWLVATHAVAPDAQLIGWTLAVFSIASGAGGVMAGALSGRLNPSMLITGTMLLGMAPLFAIFWLAPGGAGYFVAVALAGALLNAGLPIMIVAAQTLAPNRVATASGMLMGFTWGTAGVLYIGMGALQVAIGLTPAMAVSFSTLIPGAILAEVVLRRYHRALTAG